MSRTRRPPAFIDTIGPDLADAIRSARELGRQDGLRWLAEHDAEWERRIQRHRVQAEEVRRLCRARGVDCSSLDHVPLPDGHWRPTVLDGGLAG